jgi:aryl-alcohol dehydrogenase-like predicted oxidoreductase
MAFDEENGVRNRFPENRFLTPSPIGLGLAALGRPGYINLGHARDLGAEYEVTAMEAHAERVLDAAWSEGIRYFDAARSYGRAEEFLARWLTARRIAPEEVTVGSKWGYYYTAGWRTDAEQHEIKDHSLARLSQQIEESRALLGSHLDLYQIHSATRESGVLENRPVLARLAEEKRGGLRIGLTVTGPGQAETIDRALEVEIDGERLFDAVQATWNLLERSAGPALQAAHAAGLGVIVKEPLANGRLTTRNDHPDFAPKRRVLEEIAERQGSTPDAVALAAVLAEPWADVVLSGAATVEQLRSNVGARSVRLDEASLEALESLRELTEQYWATRSKLVWN